MFEEYLNAIDVSDVVHDRVQVLYTQYTQLIPASRVPHIFVNNVPSAEGTEFDSLWIYGPDYAGEYKNFQTETRFDGLKIGGISRWELTTLNFSLGETPRSRSRMSLYWRWDSIDSGLLAVGANCAQLEHFFRESILPHDSV